jgi:SAM-dependent methyltransferase
MKSFRVSDEVWVEKRKLYEQWRDSNRGRDDGSLTYKRLLADAGIAPGSLLLDVGCKDGKLAGCLPPGISYVGIDPFPFEASDRNDIFIGRAEAIPFGDDHFDVVTCFASLFHFQDLEASFKEMARVLKSGGMLLVLTIIKGPRAQMSASHTFNIDFGMMDRLTALVYLDLVAVNEVPEIESWLYKWIK